MQALLELKDISKVFEEAGNRVPVLNGISLALSAGESLAIMGPSGSGKSTLLHILGTLDTPTSGAFQVLGRNPLALGEEGVARFRNEVMGFVFQDHHLLPQYTVLENVLIPSLAFPGSAPREARAKELLERVGLSHRLSHRPGQLSGGERQRVSIARALVQNPKLLLCDEPTGNLDRETAESVANLLVELHREAQTVWVVVTHSPELAGRCNRVLELQNGCLVQR